MQSLPLAAAAAFVATLPAFASAAPFLPDFGSTTFLPGQAIDAPYFPLLPGQRNVILGTGIDEGDPVTERAEQTYEGPGKTLLGVQTITLRDRETLNGVLVEDTFDYYAQDTDGNVWYFGEDVTNYRYDDDGLFLGTDSASSWLAGMNGALPGYIMPADRVIGFEYYQEFAEADAAIDVGEIAGLGLTVDVGGRLFTDVLQIFETNPLEPDAREFKYYAPGVGLIRVEEGLDENRANPELVVDLQPAPAPVPVPAGLPLLLGAIGGLAAFRRRKS